MLGSFFKKFSNERTIRTKNETMLLNVLESVFDVTDRYRSVHI